ncbi:unnamed protein product [Rhizoctonia solani]|uniref:Nephrocystin 3-like N-terminal domain-containing protein n=1 Tax=Rhizoctonia solani TaxID=456999 RepID=A0A8H3D2P1_9AGAM|nr:unnamed protein product [Rhizoctonia solani]
MSRLRLPKISRVASARDVSETRNPSTPTIGDKPAPRCARTDASSPSGQVPSAGPSTSGETQKLNWKHLREFARISNLFGPLKNFADELIECTHIYERVSDNREEFKLLQTRLEALFEELNKHLTPEAPPVMTESIKNICRAIQVELVQVQSKQDKSRLRQAIEIAESSKQVLACYGRIQDHLHRLLLNVNLSAWKGINELVAETRLTKLTLTHSPQYDSGYGIKLGRRGCTPGTRIDVLAHISQWLDNPYSDSVYWLNGLAGTGKTTITYSICTQLHTEGRLAASFFCSRSRRKHSDACHIIPSIAYQLARFSRPFQFELLQALEENPDVHKTLPNIQFENLVSRPLERAREPWPLNSIIIIDALDECENKAGVSLILDIILTKSKNLPMKFFVSSRPESIIHDLMSQPVVVTKLALHELDESTVQGDIEKYLKESLAPINPSDQQIAMLVEHLLVTLTFPPPDWKFFGNIHKASLYNALLSLGDGTQSMLEETASQSNAPLPPVALRGPAWPSSYSSDENDEDHEDSDSEKSEDDDHEGVKHAMRTTVMPDANVEANTLSFVLQSYAQWVNFMIFDPKNVVHVIREGVIAQFSSSQDTRTRMILLSNVFGALGKSPVLNSKVRSVVTYLSAEAHQSIVRFTSTEPAPLREIDMMNALKSIDLMMEVILLRRFGGSMSSIIGLMEAASPVFRRACPEPLGQLVNLPNILVSPSINLRHYAETDIMNATLLARPMFLRYDILYTPEINEQFAGQQAGLHWLHGIPDQLIILLAWINTLHEDLGTDVDPLLISQIEMEVERVKITPSTSDDPLYTIRRFAVQECWRLVVYIHLYVTLCGAHAEDPRVVKFVKRFVRFLGGIKPARTVDTFLSLPIMFIGTFVSRKQDRDLLFRRLTTMQECTMPGRAGYDSLMVLCDIWKRTEQEQRPARWADLRISCQTIAGV